MKRLTLLLLLASLAFPLRPIPLHQDFQVEDLGLSLEQMEDKLLALANEERGRHGLPALARDPRLRAMAREHCGRMIEAGRLGHDFAGYPDLERRAGTAGLPYSKVGENVARSATFVMRFFHEALMASPAHRENILDRDFSHLGLGIAQSGDTYYVTQEFARLYEPLPPVEMETEMEKRIAVRFRNRAPLKSADFDKVRGYCRLASLAFLNGVLPARPPDTFGSALVVTVGFTEIAAGLPRLLYKLRDQVPMTWCQGVSYSRNRAYPGGAYGLTLVLFPDLRASLRQGESPEDRVFAALQRVYPFKRNLSLDLAAKRIAAVFMQSPGSAGSSPAAYRRHAVFQALSLDSLPDGIQEWTGERKSIRSVGIHVLYPLSAGLPGNYFLVAIVGQ